MRGDLGLFAEIHPKVQERCRKIQKVQEKVQAYKPL